MKEEYERNVCSRENTGFSRLEISKQRNIETSKQDMCSRENMGLRSKSEPEDSSGL